MLILLLLLAQDTNETLRLPQQLTVGVSDQFLGQLSPDGDTLYFVSNRNTTDEIQAQKVSDGHVQLLFDDGADATWPRLSPDARHILYISYRDSAAGELCVRDLPAADHRRCLTNTASAVQAEWLGADRIVLVARGGIEEDLGVSIVSVGKALASQLLFRRNLTGLAVSPDGRWLIYVPTQRYTDRVGPGFAAKAGRGLEAYRMDTHKSTPFALNLPGTSGQPAFSADGKWLYVSQFISDSNRDGITDATDHGVLFRVPFDGSSDDAPARAAEAMAEQLTESSWNCQYPSPAKATLLASCTRLTGGVDVYEMPLTGEVPPQLDAAQLRSEIDLSNRRVEELLLSRHLLMRETDPVARRQTLLNLVQLHLEFDEFDAAQHYVDELKKNKDPETRGVVAPLTQIIAHRRAVRERERGRMSTEFHDEARARVTALSPRATDSPAALVYDHLARSEIADTLGDKGAARRELEAAKIDSVAAPAVLRAYYERADALYRELDDNAALAAACRSLSEHPKLLPKEQLVYARAAARALWRGRKVGEAEAGAGPELAFALELTRLLEEVRDDKPKPEVRTAIVDLYKAQTRPDRRRALMIDAVERADEVGAERLVESLVQLYMDSAPKGSQDRVRAERLYRKVMLGRAYRHLSAKRLADAKKEFDSAVTQTHSFEALVAALDVRQQLGEPAAQISSDYAALLPAMTHFVSAYLEAQQMPSLSGEAHDASVTRATADLRAAWPALKEDRGAQALYGAVQHEHFLMHGDLDSAARANSHYLAALSLSGNNPRYRAMVLSELALLQTEANNFHIALDYFDKRDALPYEQSVRTLALRLGKARALLHTDGEVEAAKMADAALSMVEHTQALAAYLPLVLDRAALYNLAADQFERSLALYDRMAQGSGRNAWVAKLGHAAAALGAGKPALALQDLQIVEQGFSDPALLATLVWPHATREDVLRNYRLIYSGLEANAQQQVGAIDKAATALAARRELFREQFERVGRDDDLRALILVEARLADNARKRNAATDAAGWLDKARAHASALSLRTKAPIEREGLDVLWLDAAANTFGGVPMSFDLRADLASATERASRDRVWRGYQRWFETYSTLLQPY